MEYGVSVHIIYFIQSLQEIGKLGYIPLVDLFNFFDAILFVSVVSQFVMTFGDTYFFV